MSSYLPGVSAADEPFLHLQHATIAGLQQQLAAGELTSTELVDQYRNRIEALDRHGPTLKAVLEINPDADAIAAALDLERRNGRSRGPLHGIPILLKDNIDTSDRMMTTAGSLALRGTPPATDSTVAAKLRAAGAIILGKTSLSEWANFRSRHSSSGWCGRLGQGRNPYVLDRTPSGSSSGSAIAAAAALCAASIGTETDGSIVSPASACGVVGIKPSVGLVSQGGIIPISHTQDTAGIHARSVADAAALLTAIAANNGHNGNQTTEPPMDYSQFLDVNGLVNARIGIARNLGFGDHPQVDALMDHTIRALRDAGAVIVDPANIPSDLGAAGQAEMEVLLFEFKATLNSYLVSRTDIALDREGFERTLAGLIAFNHAHADEELRYFGQDLFLAAEDRGPLSSPAYREALATSQRLSGHEGLDLVFDTNGLDALIAPTAGPASPIDLVNGDATSLGTSSIAARTGYPIMSIPAGFCKGLPVNVSFFGRRYSEPTLLRLAFALEHLLQARKPPRYLPTVPLQ